MTFMESYKYELPRWAASTYMVICVNLTSFSTILEVFSLLFKANLLFFLYF